MKRFLAVTGVFITFLVFGGAWISLGRFLPVGVSRSIIMVVVGAAFAGAFVWLIVVRLREILADANQLKRQAALAFFELGLLILAFAVIYQQTGIIDNTRPESPTTHDFGLCVYYSIVTFTTLGYGDFYPMGLGRAIANIEAFTGYLILAILASTSVSILSPHQRPRVVDSEEDKN